jgi:hypothetical protein
MGHQVPSVDAIRRAMLGLAGSGRSRRVKRCATCGLPITRGRTALHLNGMDYHLECTSYRPGQRLTA